VLRLSLDGSANNKKKRGLEKKKGTPGLHVALQQRG
jgi:hypothetical protein